MSLQLRAYNSGLPLPPIFIIIFQENWHNLANTCLIDGCYAFPILSLHIDLI